MTKAGEAIRQQVLAQLAQEETQADKGSQTPFVSEIVWLREQFIKHNEFLVQLYLANKK